MSTLSHVPYSTIHTAIRLLVNGNKREYASGFPKAASFERCRPPMLLASASIGQHRWIMLRDQLPIYFLAAVAQTRNRKFTKTEQE